jgi:hypothetical protein
MLRYRFKSLLQIYRHENPSDGDRLNFSLSASSHDEREIMHYVKRDRHHKIRWELDAS